MEPRQDNLKAKNYCLRLIKFRIRSEKEVRDKLKSKEFSSGVIDEAIAYLKRAKLLDDALFAKLWVESRLKRSLGLGRLRRELKLKGIDQDIIEEALNRVKENYNEEEAITEIVRHKIKRMQKLAPEKIKSRLYGYLVRRGFSIGLVIQILIKEVGYEKIIDE